MARSRFTKDSTENQMINALQAVGQSVGLNVAFTTFLELFATSLGAEMDPVYGEERRKRYDEIMDGVPQETAAMYARLCALMGMAVWENRDDPKDILGAVYHELRLHNEWSGQFFTPDTICRMMAMITGVDQETEEVIVVNEPTCGSGAMVIGAIWAMQQKGFDYQSRILFIACDIDIRCVWMAYIQFCLYGIPAIVVHGNSLAMEKWTRWITSYAIVPLMKLQESSGQAKAEATA